MEMVNKRFYRLLLNELPEGPILGLEVRNVALKQLIQILKWVGREIIIASEGGLTIDDLLVCFYTPRTEEGVDVLEKVEAKIFGIEPLRTSFK